MRSNVVSEAGIGTHISQWLGGIPMVTMAVLVVCCTDYVISVLTGWDDTLSLCMSSFQVVQKFQVYRPFTSAFVHLGLVHITLNMFAFVPCGGALERQLGSVRFASLIVIFCALNGIVSAASAYVASVIPLDHFRGLVYECAVGFSGVMFALIVVETYASGIQSRSIFGFFTVPAKLYPWALLLLFQFLMPAVSLLGHFSGIVSGLAYAYGILNGILPSPSLCARVEALSFLAPLVRQPGFIVGGGNLSPGLPLANLDSASSGVQSSMTNLWRKVQAMAAARSLSPQQHPGGYSAIQQQDDLAPARAQETDQRFPGQGRTLGTSSSVGGAMPSWSQVPPGPLPVTHGVTSVVAAAAIASVAADSQLVRTKAPPSAQQPTWDQRDSQQSVAMLVSMGFNEAAAKSALEASNGNTEMAVEFLSGF